MSLKLLAPLLVAVLTGSVVLRMSETQAADQIASQKNPGTGTPRGDLILALQGLTKVPIETGVLDENTVDTTIIYVPPIVLVPLTVIHPDDRSSLSPLLHDSCLEGGSVRALMMFRTHHEQLTKLAARYYELEKEGDLYLQARERGVERIRVKCEGFPILAIKLVAFDVKRNIQLAVGERHDNLKYADDDIQVWFTFPTPEHLVAFNAAHASGDLRFETYFQLDSLHVTKSFAREWVALDFVEVVSAVFGSNASDDSLLANVRHLTSTEANRIRECVRVSRTGIRTGDMAESDRLLNSVLSPEWKTELPDSAFWQRLMVELNGARFKVSTTGGATERMTGEQSTTSQSSHTGGSVMGLSLFPIPIAGSAAKTESASESQARLQQLGVKGYWNDSQTEFFITNVQVTKLNDGWRSVHLSDHRVSLDVQDMPDAYFRGMDIPVWTETEVLSAIEQQSERLKKHPAILNLEKQAVKVTRDLEANHQAIETAAVATNKIHQLDELRKLRKTTQEACYEAFLGNGWNAGHTDMVNYFNPHVPGLLVAWTGHLGGPEKVLQYLRETQESWDRAVRLKAEIEQMNRNIEALAVEIAQMATDRSANKDVQDLQRVRTELQRKSVEIGSRLDALR